MMRASLLITAAFALIPTLTRADDLLDKSPSKFAKSADIKVHYKSIGEGKTALVFIHGWCCDLTVWRDQAPAFDGHIRAIYIDLPGYGQSDKPKIDYTMDLFAKAINSVLEDAGVDQAVLAGHSMGTPVVRQFYRLYPAKTKALVFIDGALRHFTTDPQRKQAFIAMWKEQTFKQTAAQFFSRMYTDATPAERRKQLDAIVAAAEPHVAISSMRGMFDDDIFKEDPIKVPSQALMAKSPFWNDDYKAFVRKLIPDLDYREFDGVGHLLFMEKPKEFNDALTEFLKKQGVL